MCMLVYLPFTKYLSLLRDLDLDLGTRSLTLPILGRGEGL